MKKILVVVASLSFFISANAQIPNGDFEAWNSNNGMSIEVPNSPWITSNLDQKPVGVTFNAITKSTDHYPVSVGQYAIRIENNISIVSEPGSQMPYWQCAYGFAVTAFYPGYNGPVFPIAGHPTSLKGYYKFLPQNGDTMEIGIALYKDGNLVSQNGFFSTSTVADWTSFSIDIPSYIDADSAQIGLTAFYSPPFQYPTGPYGNSVLFVDNLNFDNLIVGTEDLIENQLEIYPNPAKDYILVEYAGKSSEIFIYNLQGELVKKLEITSEKNKVNVSSFKSGIYVLKLTNENGIYQRKLIIE